MARIRQARAALGTSQASTVPALNGSAAASRGNTTGSAASVLNGGLDASWEIDLFGSVRRSVEGAQARVDAKVAGWHDAQVTLAAEVAQAYSQRRQCEALQVLNQMDLASREATSQLTALKLQAGFAAPADLQLTEASVAAAVNTLLNQTGTCAQSLNQLVALTGLPHADLQQRLAAASAAIGQAQANRLPRLSLAGSISHTHTQAGGVSASGTGWSFGPSLSLPIFDGGSGAAAVESARGSYDEALGAWQASVRQAVQDVENALVRVATISRSEGAAQRASERYRAYFQAAETQYQLGAASLLTLEDARRTVVSSEQSLVAARLEQVQAWIALYKAVGGGWSDASTAPASTPAGTPPGNPASKQASNQASTRSAQLARPERNTQ